MPNDDCLFIRLGDFFAARRAGSDPEQPLAPPEDAPQAVGAVGEAATRASHRPGGAPDASVRVRPTS